MPIAVTKNANSLIINSVSKGKIVVPLLSNWLPLKTTNKIIVASDNAMYGKCIVFMLWLILRKIKKPTVVGLFYYLASSTMWSTAALTSSSLKSGRPPRAGIMLKPLIAFEYKVSTPFSIRGAQSEALPNLGELIMPDA